MGDTPGSDSSGRDEAEPSSPHGLGRIRDTTSPPGNIRDLKAIYADPSKQKLFAQAPSGSLANLPLVPPAPPEASSTSIALPWGHNEKPRAMELKLDGLPGVEEKHIMQAFKEIDFDNNGFVGVGELRYLLVAMGERPTDDELDEMLRLFDIDGNGQISYDEFLLLFTNSTPVLAEMITMAPVEIEKDPSDAQQPVIMDSPGRARLLIKGAAGILHAFNKDKRDKERKRALPAPKAAAPGSTRARPGKPKQLPAPKAAASPHAANIVESSVPPRLPPSYGGHNARRLENIRASTQSAYGNTSRFD